MSSVAAPIPPGSTPDPAAAAPPTAPAPLRATPGERAVSAILAALAITVLGVAAWLQPASNGIGTHQALGLAPCGWVVGMNLPCPTCGMTTAFAHAVRGSLWESARVQPMGMLLAVGTAAVAVVGTFVALTGSRVGHVLGARITPRAVVVLASLALVAWGYKVMAMRGAWPTEPGTNVTCAP